MKRRDERIRQMDAVGRECRVIAVAAAALRDRLDADPSALRGHGLKRPDFTRAVDRLDATYVVRLFAEFEAGLREAWERRFGQSTHPPTAQLMRAIVARCKVPEAWAAAADEVRQYRNALVHEGDDSAVPIPLDDAGVRLKRFFSRLPAHW